MRSTRKMVTFQMPFSLRGVDGIQPPGTYAVVTDEEEIPGLSFAAWRRVETCLRLPRVDVNTGQEQMISISPRDLAAALAKDDGAPAGT